MRIPAPIIVLSAIAALAVVSNGQQQPLVFVGTSQAGGTDPHYFVNPLSSGIVYQGGITFTDNVTDAVFADNGTNLYVASSGVIPRGVSRAQLGSGAPVWSQFYNPNAACYGLGLDASRRRLYVVVGPAGNQELFALDADSSSPTYGQVLGATTTLTGPYRWIWELSPSGNYAAVTRYYLLYGAIDIVDTNPTSPSYMQAIALLQLPGAQNGDNTIDCALTHDDRYVLLLWEGSSGRGLGVYDLVQNVWLDFDPAAAGVQNFGITLRDMDSMDISRDDTFAVIASDAGWAARVDLDYAIPSNSTFTHYLPGMGLLPNCRGVSLSSDSTQLAVTTRTLAGVARCVVINAHTGTVASTVQLPGALYAYTTAWQQIGSAPVSYCTAGITTSGCQASIQGSGTASATQSSGFTITVSEVEGRKPGTIFYGIGGRSATPWGSSNGYWCVQPPTQSTMVAVSSGTKGTCGGVLFVDWNSYIFTHPGALGAPFGAGQLVQAQGWFRDPMNVQTSMLSNALEFSVTP